MSRPRIQDDLPSWTRPEWHRDALCKEFPGMSWFPVTGQSLTELKAVCERCVVNTECLDAALERSEVGVWGGTSSRQRLTIRRAAA